jgi:hypothetical protein
VIPNLFGISFKSTPLTDVMMKYVLAQQNKVFAFPWFYYLLGLFTLVHLRLRRTVFEIRHVLLYSSLLYWLPTALVTASAEQRYHSWSLVAVAVSCVLTIWILLAENSKQSTTASTATEKTSAKAGKEAVTTA